MLIGSFALLASAISSAWLGPRGLAVAFVSVLDATECCAFCGAPASLDVACRAGGL